MSTISSHSIKVSHELYHAAKFTADAEMRSISSQIEFWATVGRAALDNPDLPIDMIKDIIIATRTNKNQFEPFIA